MRRSITWGEAKELAKETKAAFNGEEAGPEKQERDPKGKL